MNNPLGMELSVQSNISGKTGRGRCTDDVFCNDTVEKGIVQQRPDITTAYVTEWEAG